MKAPIEKLQEYLEILAEEDSNRFDVAYNYGNLIILFEGKCYEVAETGEEFPDK
jgi:hypothetical protein